MPRVRNLISALMLIGFAVAGIRLAIFLTLIEPPTGTMVGLILIWLQRALEVPIIFAVDHFTATLPTRWRIIVHTAALVVVLLAAAGTLTLMTVLFGAPLVPFEVTSPHVLMMSVLIYVGVAAVSASARNSQRLLEQELAEERLRTECARDELKAMRAQFQPATVVAALGRVETMIESDVAEAERALTLVADFLSLTMRRFGRERIPIKAEADFAAAFIQLRAFCGGAACEARVSGSSSAEIEPGRGEEWIAQIERTVPADSIARLEFVLAEGCETSITIRGRAGEIVRLSGPPGQTTNLRIVAGTA